MKPRNPFGSEALGERAPLRSPHGKKFPGKKRNRGNAKHDGPEFLLDEEVVPPPSRERLGAKPVYFPFGEMEVGRSFTTHRVKSTVRKAIGKYRKVAPEREFTLAVKDGRTRCWRTK